MAAKEFRYTEQEAGEEESTLLQDPYEEEEALSLCDLPIYSNSISSQWGDHFSKEDEKNTRTKNNNDEDNEDEDFFEFFSEEFTTPRSENIIFCGKIIPFKDSNESKSTKHNHIQKGMKKIEETKSAKGNNNNVSLMRSTTKSRWFVFMFGMSKISTEMELGDIRNRQSRRGPATMFPVPEKGKSKGVWKLFRSKISLLLGCNGIQLSNDVVRAAFV